MAQNQNIPQVKGRSALAALLLTLVTNGLGQFYNGQPVKGAVYFLLMAFISVWAAVFDSFGTFSSLVWILIAGAAAKITAFIDAAVGALNRQHYVPKPYNRWYYYLAIAVLANLLFMSLDPFSGQYQGYKVPSGSMLPTIEAGDYILADKSFVKGRPLARGDIVLFARPDQPQKTYVKRVMGLPGETFEIKGDKVYINGQAIEDPWGKFVKTDKAGDPPPNRSNFGPKKIPVDSYIVLGDNRYASLDSRTWPGSPFLARAAITGRALYVYWSSNYDRLGESLRLARTE